MREVKKHMVHHSPVAESWANGTCIMWTEVIAIRPARWFER